jgi:hypothetical protein
MLTRDLSSSAAVAVMAVVRGLVASRNPRSNFLQDRPNACPKTPLCVTLEGEGARQTAKPFRLLASFLTPHRRRRRRLADVCP